MKKVVIVSGGKIEDFFVTEWITEQKPDEIIAVDSGMEYFRRTGKKPDLILGDFDSVREETLAYFEKQEGIIWKRLNPVKDDTDTEAALRYAIKTGAEQIVLLGATGSRLDHVLGNIELLGIGLEAGAEILLVDAHNRIRMIKSGIQLKKEEQFGKYVSLIPYSSEVKHLYLKGFKYPLEDFILRGFCSLGVSNEIIADTAEIFFEEGILLVIESRD